MNYALITGASSGIGRCYAEELAQRGYNIIAVSNQQQPLIEMCGEISSHYGIRAEYIYINLAESDAARQIYNRCNSEGWIVDLLICNAGMLLFSTLVRTSPDSLASIINLHCMTTTLLCRYFGEQMKQRGSGRILIMSSSTAWLPYPTISHYAATKAYLKSFASSLWYELHRYGVSVTVIFPGAVDTPLYTLSPRLRRLFVTTGIMHRPETIAQRGIRAMLHGRRRLVPGLFTKIVVAICAVIPARILDVAIRIRPIKRLLERI